MAVVPSLWVGNMGGKNERTTDNADADGPSADTVRAALSVPEPDRTLAVEAGPTPDGGTPTPAPTVAPLSVEPEPVLTDIEAAICAYGWDCWTALRIARCESGPDYIAGYNGHGAAGTFQLMPVHAWRFEARGWSFYDDALIPERNIAVAFDLWSEQGWRPWACW